MAEPETGRQRHAVIHCGPEHLEAIRGIYNHEILHTTALYEYEPRSAETMATWWAAKQAAGLPVLGIEAGPGVLAAFATWGPFRVFPAYQYSVEHSVYVDAQFQRHGLGRTLLTALVEEATARNLHMMVGVIDATNTASIGLHRQRGFAHCGTVREAGFKFGRWLDVEFWQLLLPTATGITVERPKPPGAVQASDSRAG
jgi:phosphinothricin acetyltransferase